jgi:hypothetical protein
MVAEKKRPGSFGCSGFWHDGWGESFYAKLNGSILWHRGRWWDAV